MQPRAGSRAKSKKERERLLKLRAANCLQRSFRRARVQKALAYMVEFEEKVLKKPLSGAAAFELLSPPEVDPSRPGSAATLPGSDHLEHPAVGPDEFQVIADALQGKGTAGGRRGILARSKTCPDYSAAFLEAGTDVAEGPPTITKEGLASHLETAGVENTAKAAQSIFWLLKVDDDGLTVGHLQQIYKHHKMRQKNAASRVVLRLGLIQHGDSDRSSAPRLAGADSRPLLPEGLAQVTRTAWSLRACREWTPNLILHGSERCCHETVERLLLVTDGFATNPDASDRGGAASASQAKPVVKVCTELDHPNMGSAVGPRHWVIAEAVGKAAGETDMSSALKSAGLPPPPLVLAVAGGSLVETLLACMTANGLRNDVAAQRLGGGDVLLLRSPTMAQIVGDDGEERTRPPSELWEEALKQNQWTLVHHFHGNGGAPELGVPASSGYTEPSASKQLPRTRDTWRAYTGEPLVLGHREFSQLCVRAGCQYRPLPGDITSMLRPLVRNYVSPDEDENEDERPVTS